MIDLHDLFDDWLVAGAEGEPPRDVAVHASGCDACLRSIAAVDSLQAIEIGRASLPPLAMAPTGRESMVRAMRYAVGAVAVVLLGGSVAIGASGLLRPTQTGSNQEAPSAAEGVLAGVPSAPVGSQPDSEQPAASASDSGKPKQPVSEDAAVALATPAPQVLPHSTPSPQPPGTPQPTAAPTRTPAPTAAAPTAAATAAATATPIVTPSPTLSASPPIDTDGDGVPDVIDECPTVPAGDFPDPLHPGCPLPAPSPSPSDPSPSP